MVNYFKLIILFSVNAYRYLKCDYSLGCALRSN